MAEAIFVTGVRLQAALPDREGMHP